MGIVWFASQKTIFIAILYNIVHSAWLYHMETKMNSSSFINILSRSIVCNTIDPTLIGSIDRSSKKKKLLQSSSIKQTKLKHIHKHTHIHHVNNKQSGQNWWTHVFPFNHYSNNCSISKRWLCLISHVLDRFGDMMFSWYIICARFDRLSNRQQQTKQTAKHE